MSVCILAGLLKNYWSNLCDILWNGWRTQSRDQSDFEWPWTKVKVTRGQRSKSFLLQIIPFKSVTESRNRIKLYILFNSLNISNYEYGRRLTISDISIAQRSDSEGVRSQW